MVTLKQIAAAAGVHLTTVSAVINASQGNTRVGEATSNRVLKIAKKMGYVRNESARRLRTGQSNIVGFIGGDLRNPFFSELAAALEHELQLHNLQLLLSHVSFTRSNTFSKTVELFQQQTVSKIIYWDESASRITPEAPANCVMFPIGFTVRPQPGVWLDLGHAIRTAVDHFVKRKLRQICFYAPAGMMESPSVDIRKKMFLDECRRQSLPPPICATYDGESWNIEAALGGARELLKQQTTIEAFVGFNDIAALGILLAIGDMQFKPSVICFDGTALTRVWPGQPPVFDLKISRLAQQAVAVFVGRQTLDVTGRKDQWLRPELIA